MPRRQQLSQQEREIKRRERISLTRTFRKWKAGDLHSGTGVKGQVRGKVSYPDSHKQAIAIALSKAEKVAENARDETRPRSSKKRQDAAYWQGRMDALRLGWRQDDVGQACGNSWISPEFECRIAPAADVAPNIPPDASSGADHSPQASLVEQGRTAPDIPTPLAPGGLQAGDLLGATAEVAVGLARDTLGAVASGVITHAIGIDAGEFLGDTITGLAETFDIEDFDVEAIRSSAQAQDAFVGQLRDKMTPEGINAAIAKLADAAAGNAEAGLMSGVAAVTVSLALSPVLGPLAAIPAAAASGVAGTATKNTVRHLRGSSKGDRAQAEQSASSSLRSLGNLARQLQDAALTPAGRKTFQEELSKGGTKGAISLAVSAAASITPASPFADQIGSVTANMALATHRRLQKRRQQAAPRGDAFSLDDLGQTSHYWQGRNDARWLPPAAIRCMDRQMSGLDNQTSSHASLDGSGSKSEQILAYEQGRLNALAQPTGVFQRRDRGAKGQQSTSQRCGNSWISANYECRIGAGEAVLSEPQEGMAEQAKQAPKLFNQKPTPDGANNTKAFLLQVGIQAAIEATQETVGAVTEGVVSAVLGESAGGVLGEAFKEVAGLLGTKTETITKVLSKSGKKAMEGAAKGAAETVAGGGNKGAQAGLISSFRDRFSRDNIQQTLGKLAKSVSLNAGAGAVGGAAGAIVGLMTAPMLGPLSAIPAGVTTSMSADATKKVVRHVRSLSAEAKAKEEKLATTALRSLSSAVTAAKDVAFTPEGRQTFKDDLKSAGITETIKFFAGAVASMTPAAPFSNQVSAAVAVAFNAAQEKFGEQLDKQTKTRGERRQGKSQGSRSRRNPKKAPSRKRKARRDRAKYRPKAKL